MPSDCPVLLLTPLPNDVIEVTPRRALLRFALAAILVPTGISLLWACFDREGLFLHDRLAGTRLVLTG